MRYACLTLGPARGAVCVSRQGAGLRLGQHHLPVLLPDEARAHALQGRAARQSVAQAPRTLQSRSVPTSSRHRFDLEYRVDEHHENQVDLTNVSTANQSIECRHRPAAYRSLRDAESRVVSINRFFLGSE